MNLEIQFNANIVRKVKSLNFQVDQIGSILFILFCLYEEKYELLDEFDDFNKERRAFILYKGLEMKNLIQKNSDKGKTLPHYILTKDGAELVDFIKSEFITLDEVVTSETIAVSGVENLKTDVIKGTVDEWIDEWIELFPRGVKSGGRLLRSDKQSCLRKMKVFLREYNYSKDVIMAATAAYLNSKRNENYAYTRCAVYFIYRVEASSSGRFSDLASWCDQVQHEKQQPKHDSENNLEIMV